MGFFKSFRDWCRDNPLPRARSCPPTQSIHHEVKGARFTTLRLLLAEVKTATGREFPAVEKMVHY